MKSVLLRSSSFHLKEKLLENNNFIHTQGNKLGSFMNKVPILFFFTSSGNLTGYLTVPKPLALLLGQLYKVLHNCCVKKTNIL